MSAHAGGASRVRKKKRKKKVSVDSNPRSPSSTLQKVESSSHKIAGSVGSTQSLNAKSKRKKVKKTKNLQHSRYATAHTKIQAHHKRKPKKRNKPKNKIKARNKANKAAAHHKAATTANALEPNRRNNKKNAHYSSATSPNALVASGRSSPNSSKYRARTPSNPRQFRHKFNVTEMQLVIGQIGEMKKSWKTPAESAMGKIYEIVYMEERPHLNGKYCKVICFLDEDNYRVALLGNASEHVVARENLKVAFETENLFLLWESQQKGTKSSKGRSTWGNEYGDHPLPPSGKPPHQDPDDMFTIQQFEHSFNDTYEFRRYDFYCMGFCIVLGVILSGCGAFLYIKNDASNDLHAMGAFTVIFAPILGILCGAYIGCLWYCCAVGKGKMEYYLGNNRFFGCKCEMCDCCKYQYFIVVAFIGILIVLISAAAFLLFDKFVHVDDIKTDTNNTNPVETDRNGEVSINETKLFMAVEILCACGGIGLCVSGIMAYHCCTSRYAKETRKRDSSLQEPDSIITN